MKYIMYGLVGGAIVILSLVAVITIEGRTTRENEMDNALLDSVEETMEEMMMQETYSLAEKNEYIAAFHQCLLNRINAGTKDHYDKNLSIVVEVMGCDVEKGLLSVRVTETFTHPNGNIGKAECEATAVLEQTNPKNHYTITYYIGDEIYKRYCMEEGQAMKIPKNPYIAGKIFVGWKSMDSGEILERREMMGAHVQDNAETGAMKVPVVGVYENHNYSAVFK